MGAEWEVIGGGLLIVSGGLLIVNSKPECRGCAGTNPRPAIHQQSTINNPQIT
jgi:hypothetical protein